MSSPNPGIKKVGSCGHGTPPGWTDPNKDRPRSDLQFGVDVQTVNLGSFQVDSLLCNICRLRYADTLYLPCTHICKYMYESTSPSSTGVCEICAIMWDLSHMTATAQKDRVPTCITCRSNVERRMVVDLPYRNSSLNNYPKAIKIARNAILDCLTPDMKITCKIVRYFYPQLETGAATVTMAEVRRSKRARDRKTEIQDSVAAAQAMADSNYQALQVPDVDEDPGWDKANPEFVGEES